jgi:hypothetical protein
VTIFAWLHTLLLMAVLTGGAGFHPPWRGHHARHVRHEQREHRDHRHHRDHRAKVVVAAHEDGHETLKVRTHKGATHVKLGAGRHGLEVWTDEGGKTRVDLGDALNVETDERGGSKVRLGDLAVDTDGSD